MFELRFVRFLATIFKYCWVIFIMRDWLEFYISGFWLHIGLMLYHCLRRWPNIKTTLRRRFVFDTTVSSMLKCNISKVLLFMLVQCWAALSDEVFKGCKPVVSPLTMGPYIDWSRFIHGLLPTSTSMYQHWSTWWSRKSWKKSRRTWRMT